MADRKIATALILAGGRSSRFGSDKSQLKLNGRQVVEILAEEATKVCDEVLIVTDSGQKFAKADFLRNFPQVREIADNCVGMGPMGGLQAGLAAATNEICLLMACDMPLLNGELMGYFIDRAEAEYQIALPQNGDDIEPMFGIYKKSLLPLVEKLLAEQRRSLLNLTKNAPTLLLPVADWRQAAGDRDVFFNVNYCEDYQSLLAGNNDHSRQKERKNYYKQFLAEEKRN